MNSQLPIREYALYMLNGDGRAVSTYNVRVYADRTVSVNGIDTSRGLAASLMWLIHNRPNCDYTIIKHASAPRPSIISVSDLLLGMSEPLNAQSSDEAFMLHMDNVDAYCEQHGLDTKHMMYLLHLVKTGRISDFPGELQPNLQPVAC